MAAALRALVDAAGRRLGGTGCADWCGAPGVPRPSRAGRGSEEGLGGIGRVLAASDGAQRAVATVQECARGRAGVTGTAARAGAKGGNVMVLYTDRGSSSAGSDLDTSAMSSTAMDLDDPGWVHSRALNQHFCHQGPFRVRRGL